MFRFFSLRLACLKPVSTYCLGYVSLRSLVCKNCDCVLSQHQQKTLRTVHPTPLFHHIITSFLCFGHEHVFWESFLISLHLIHLIKQHLSFEPGACWFTQFNWLTCCEDRWSLPHPPTIYTVSDPYSCSHSKHFTAGPSSWTQCIDQAVEWVKRELTESWSWRPRSATHKLEKRPKSSTSHHLQTRTVIPSQGDSTGVRTQSKWTFSAEFLT